MSWTQDQYDAVMQSRQKVARTALAPLRATNGQPAMRGKHGSRKTLLDGITFDSAKEAARYSTLKLWQQVGAIRDLRLQVSYDLYGANGERVAKYLSDFTYWSVELNKEVVEDVKSPHTRTLPVYRLKLKLLRAQGVTISEV